MSVMHNTIPTINVNAHFEGLEERVDFVETLNRRIVSIYNTDDEITILKKLLSAIEYKNCDVHFQFGTYTFDAVYDEMFLSKYNVLFKNNGVYELPVGGGCRYFLHDSTLISNYTGTNLSRGFNLMGTLRSPQDFEIHDGTLIATHLNAYCFHDESQGQATPCVHKYKNIRMIHIAGVDSDPIDKCIGGGLGQYVNIVIDGCYFEVQNKEYIPNLSVISYHGINNETVQAHSNIVVKK